MAGLLPEKETALLAVSGGRDSMCMASLFLESGRKFAVAHCNFHLRAGESDSDEELVRGWASRSGVPFHVADFDTERYASCHSVSIEMAARELRYDWFATLCRQFGYYAVSVAHNANDNAETLILNLLRGTGTRGLSGMREESEVSVSKAELRGVRLIRPLLSFPRADIDRYVASVGLEYHDDRTNAETLFKRNAIRHKVFPVFEELNPSFLSTFEREMKVFAGESAVAEDFFAAARARVNADVTGDECLRVDLDALSREKHMDYILFRLLEPFGFRGKLLDPIARLVAGGGHVAGRVFEAPGYRAVTASGRLSVFPCDVKNHADMAESVSVDSESCYQIGESSFTVECESAGPDPAGRAVELAGDGVMTADTSALTFPFTVRRWRDGDWMRPKGLRGRKKLSDLFVDLKLGIDEKGSALVAELPGDEKSAGSHAAAVFGYASGRFYCRVDEAVALSSGTVSMLKITLNRQ